MYVCSYRTFIRIYGWYQGLIDSKRRRGHVTLMYSTRDNKIQTSSRTTIFSNISCLSDIDNTEFVTIFRGHVTLMYSSRDNKIQTSSRTVLFLVTLAALVTDYTEFVTIFSIG